VASRDVATNQTDVATSKEPHCLSGPTKCEEGYTFLPRCRNSEAAGDGKDGVTGGVISRIEELTGFTIFRHEYCLLKSQKPVFALLLESF